MFCGLLFALLLNDNLELDAAQLKLVPIFDHVKQVRGQTLPIYKGAVGAADVLDQVNGASPVDLAVTARDAIRELYAGAKVQIWEHVVFFVETPDVDLCTGR